MISVFYLLAVIVGMTLQNVFKKQYNQKTANRGGATFCALSTVFAAVVFLVFAKYPLHFDTGFVGYSVGFAVSYSVSVIFSVLAISCGSLALTSLFISYSLIIPTAYGIFFQHSPISVAFVIGLVLFAVSLFLINYTKDESDADTKITLKWVIFAVLAFFGNGMCSTVQNMQVTSFKGEMKSEFMILAYIISMVGMLVYALFTEKRDIIPSAKKGFLPVALCGLFNGIVNLSVILAVERGEIPSAVLYPTVSAGGMILTFLISTFIYREKMSKSQITGFFVGVVSVVLLNL